MVIDTQTLDEIWQQVWQTLTPNQAMPDLQAVLNAYAQPQRHYHTVQHLQECLQWWQRCQEQMQIPAEVALALFYHDIVYDPKRSDNELQSANTMLAHLASPTQRQHRAHLPLDFSNGAPQQPCSAHRR